MMRRCFSARFAKNRFGKFTLTVDDLKFFFYKIILHLHVTRHLNGKRKKGIGCRRLSKNCASEISPSCSPVFSAANSFVRIRRRNICGDGFSHQNRPHHRWNLFWMNAKPFCGWIWVRFARTWSRNSMQSHRMASNGPNVTCVPFRCQSDSSEYVRRSSRLGVFFFSSASLLLVSIPLYANSAYSCVSSSYNLWAKDRINFIIKPTWKQRQRKFSKWKFNFEQKQSIERVSDGRKISRIRCESRRINYSAAASNRKRSMWIEIDTHSAYTHTHICSARTADGRWIKCISCGWMCAPCVNVHPEIHEFN